MKLMHTDIPDVVIVEQAVFKDDRGWFTESYNDARFRAALTEAGLPAPRPFVQDNHSVSSKGVLRGLHYQLPPHPQGKLVRVVKGAAYDVAVDLRKGSPTFGKWTGVELSASNHLQLWVPEGFAHGFLALEDDTHFLYKTTDYYAKDCERAILWNDADIGIQWPLSGAPLLGPKDAVATSFRQADTY